MTTSLLAIAPAKECTSVPRATEPALLGCDLEAFAPVRRRGHARAIHAESVARAAGATAVRLTVWAGSDGARELYRAAGYRDECHQMRLPITRI